MAQNIFIDPGMKKTKKSAAKAEHSNKKSIQQVKLAVKNEFYLEASWLISSLLESRLKNLLRKADHQQPSAGFTLEQSIKRVKFLLLTSENAALTGAFDVGLIDEIRNWKNQRNTILKDMLDVHVSQSRLERLSADGMRLYREWKKAAKKFKSDHT